MRFGFSEEQGAFGESARRLFADVFPERAVRAFRERPQVAREWQVALAEGGLLGILAPDASGGLGLSLVDALPVAIEAGRACIPFPLSDAILAAAALAEAQPDIAGAIVAGEALAVLDDLSPAAVQRTADGSPSVHGIVDAVAFADAARWLLATAQTPGGTDLLLIDLDRAERTPIESYDRTVSAVRLAFESVPAVSLGAAAAGELAARHAVLVAAELLGVARSAFETSIDYARTREQFGRPIGSYQAIKHLLADAAVRVESMQVAVQYAAYATDSGAPDRDLAVLAARTYCAGAARDVCESAIQLHGGIGFTWEFGLHFPLRRAVRLAATGGTTATHRERLAQGLVDRVMSGRGLHH